MSDKKDPRSPLVQRLSSDAALHNRGGEIVNRWCNDGHGTFVSSDGLLAALEERGFLAAASPVEESD